MSEDLKILLIQARLPSDLMCAHEHEAFAARCQLPLSAVVPFNFATEDHHQLDLSAYDGLMVGGSGDFSLVQGGFDWHQDFLDFLRGVLTRDIPMFASCFGFQGLVQALGGRLASDPARAELGTFEVSLTEEGRQDPLFGNLPDHFDAQFGHNDSAITLPDELIHLASSQRCIYQAIRVKGHPVVATQFHPELTREGNLDRFRNYMKHYKNPDHSFEEALAHAESIHRESPYASSLLHAFISDLHARKISRQTAPIADEKQGPTTSVLDIDDPVLRGYTHLGLTEWRRLGHIPGADALREFALAAEMTPAHNEAAEELSEKLVEEARPLIQHEEHRKAEELLRLATLLSPNDTKPCYLLADHYMRYFLLYKNDDDRNEAIYLARHVLSLDPEHPPAQALIKRLIPTRTMDVISWKLAAMIVAILVLISGTMTVCLRFTMVPDVDPSDTERVREYFDGREVQSQSP